MKRKSILGRLFLVTVVIPLFAGSALSHPAQGPRGSQEIPWQPSHVSRVVAAGYGDTFGLETAAKLGPAYIESVGARQCVNASFLVFDVDDDFAWDLDESVTLDLLFDARRSSGIWVGYDANVIAENATLLDFENSSSLWHRQTVTLERARFANRGQSGGDFALAAPSAMWPGTVDKDHRFVLCDVQITRSNQSNATSATGMLNLSVFEGEPRRAIPARIGLYDASGRMPLPSAEALSIANYADEKRAIFLRNTPGRAVPWPSKNRFVFYVNGGYRSQLPAGRYDLIVSRGPEYSVVQREFEIGKGLETNVAVNLERWIDMPARHWYSGDDHIHIARTAGDNLSVLTLTKAEDIHVSNILQMGNPAHTYFHQYAWGKSGRFQQGHHTLASGLEDPRTAVRGHTLRLNVNQAVRDPATYLQYDKVYEQYAAQGALSGFAHIAGKLFNVERGAAVDVPLGTVDFFEVLQAGELETALWYHYLNLGFKLIPTAGSDFPYLNTPGAERTYVLVESAFSLDAWFKALGQGHTFVTNGPLLEFEINGVGMGHEINLRPGTRLEISASAALAPGAEALQRIELVRHGRVIQVAGPAGADNKADLHHEMTASSGAWFAVRAYGETQAVAHSAPIYVRVDGGGFAADALVPGLVAESKMQLDALANSLPDVDMELEPWEVGHRLRTMWANQRSAIQRAVAAAHETYDQIASRSAQKTSEGR